MLWSPHGGEGVVLQQRGWGVCRVCTCRRCRGLQRTTAHGRAPPTAAIDSLLLVLLSPCCSGELGNTLLAALVGERSPTNGLFVRQRLLFGQFINLLVAGVRCCAVLCCTAHGPVLSSGWMHHTCLEGCRPSGHATAAPSSRANFATACALPLSQHETTANTMGFLMYYLSQNPSWEEALRKEIRVSVSGGHSLQSVLTAHVLPTSPPPPCLEWVCNEMRRGRSQHNHRHLVVLSCAPPPHCGTS